MEAEAKELGLLDERDGWVSVREEGKSKRLVIGGQGQPKEGELYCVCEDDRRLQLRRKGRGREQLV